MTTMQSIKDIITTPRIVSLFDMSEEHIDIFASVYLLGKIMSDNDVALGLNIDADGNITDMLGTTYKFNLANKAIHVTWRCYSCYGTINDNYETPASASFTIQMPNGSSYNNKSFADKFIQMYQQHIARTYKIHLGRGCLETKHE